jgi:hypothetical protein
MSGTKVSGAAGNHTVPQPLAARGMHAAHKLKRLHGIDFRIACQAIEANDDFQLFAISLLKRILSMQAKALPRRNAGGTAVLVLLRSGRAARRQLS